MALQFWVIRIGLLQLGHRLANALALRAIGGDTAIACRLDARPRGIAKRLPSTGIGLHRVHGQSGLHPALDILLAQSAPRRPGQQRHSQQSQRQTTQVHYSSVSSLAISGLIKSMGSGKMIVEF